MKNKEKFLKTHKVASSLTEKELDFALALADEHNNIRLYRSRGDIILCRDAMYSESVREPFIIRGKPKEKPKPKIVSPWEECAQAIHDAKSATQEIHRLGESLRAAFYVLETVLPKIRQVQKDNNQLDTLTTKIDNRLRLFRSIETGSFMIEVNQILDDAWSRLP